MHRARLVLPQQPVLSNACKAHSVGPYRPDMATHRHVKQLTQDPGLAWHGIVWCDVQAGQ